MMLTLVVSSGFAQKSVTEEFVVEGICEMCEAKIEKAALVKGVKLASWDIKNDTLKVIFNADKTSLEIIQKAISMAGYDTPLFPAEDPDYESLPACCKHRDPAVEKH